MRNGWFHTGDIGILDEEGYLAVVDRKKDMILRGGFNVYPRELEEVIMTHPAVSLVAVVGIPDERLGEEVKAFIVRKPGATATEEELLEWFREQFASYKYPRSVEFRDSLPMGATGKILKRELKAAVPADKVPASRTPCSPIAAADSESITVSYGVSPMTRPAARGRLIRSPTVVLIGRHVDNGVRRSTAVTLSSACGRMLASLAILLVASEEAFDGRSAAT